MDSTLPIVVKPSRILWGVFALLMGGFCFLIVEEAITSPLEGWQWLWLIFPAGMGVMALGAVWTFIFAPPKMIIDENGVSGRPFMRLAIRIPWDDIVWAKFEQARIERFGYKGIVESMFNDVTQMQFLSLHVDNTSGKYNRAEKVQSEEGRNIRKIRFQITLAAVRKKRAKEIAEIINNLTKTTLAERQQMTKSPFASQ